MPKRLELPDDLFPVQAFFNALSSKEFLEALDRFGEGKGFNPEDITCFFPSDLSEDEFRPIDSYDYIEMWTYAGDQEIHVSFEDFVSFLEVAARFEVKNNPDLASLINEKTRQAREVISAFKVRNEIFNKKNA